MDYKELKNHWYQLKKRGLYFEADQVRHKLKQWRKRMKKKAIKA